MLNLIEKSIGMYKTSSWWKFWDISYIRVKSNSAILDFYGTEPDFYFFSIEYYNIKRWYTVYISKHPTRECPDVYMLNIDNHRKRGYWSNRAPETIEELDFHMEKVIPLLEEIVSEKSSKTTFYIFPYIGGKVLYRTY